MEKNGQAIIDSGYNMAGCGGERIIRHVKQDRPRGEKVLEIIN